MLTATSGFASGAKSADNVSSTTFLSATALTSLNAAADTVAPATVKSEAAMVVSSRSSLNVTVTNAEAALAELIVGLVLSIVKLALVPVNRVELPASSVATMSRKNSVLSTTVIPPLPFAKVHAPPWAKIARYPSAIA